MLPNTPKCAGSGECDWYHQSVPHTSGGNKSDSDEPDPKTAERECAERLPGGFFVEERPRRDDTKGLRGKNTLPERSPSAQLCLTACRKVLVQQLSRLNHAPIAHDGAMRLLSPVKCGGRADGILGAKEKPPAAGASPVGAGPCARLPRARTSSLGEARWGAHPGAPRGRCLAA